MGLAACASGEESPPPIQSTSLTVTETTSLRPSTPFPPTITDTPPATPTIRQTLTLSPTALPTSVPTHTPEPTPFDLSVKPFSVPFALPFDLDDQIAFYIQDNRFTISNIENPQNPQNLWQSDFLGDKVQGLGVISNHAYLVNDNNLLVWNIDNILNPIIITNVSVNSGQPYLDADGKRLYLVQISTEGSQITTIDLSTPDSPRELGTANLNWSEVFFPFMISENLLFLATQDYIEIIDISDPGSVVHLAQITVPTNINSEMIMLDKLLLVGTHSGTFIFDLTDTANPQMVEQYSNLPLNHLSLAGNVAYLYSEICGWEPTDDGGVSGACGYLIEMVDFSDLNHPNLRGYINLGFETNQSTVESITLRDNQMFFETADDTLYMLDISKLE